MNTTENASSTDLTDLEQALHLLQLAAKAAKLAVARSKQAAGHYEAATDDDDRADDIALWQHYAGDKRDEARRWAEKATAILARLSALRD